MESGVGGYLAKPFSSAAFLDAVQRALALSTDGLG
jgi:FixJ family two-component response regulator